MEPCAQGAWCGLNPEPLWLWAMSAPCACPRTSETVSGLGIRAALSLLQLVGSVGSDTGPAQPTWPASLEEKPSRASGPQGLAICLGLPAPPPLVCRWS